MRRPVAITGVGAVTPLGVGAGPLFERWKDGECALEDGFGRCSDFEATDFMTAKEVRRSDRFAQFGVAACEEAFADAGWDDGLPYDSERVGCVMGTGVGGLGTLEEQHILLNEQGPKQLSPLAVPLLMANAGAAALAMRHKLRGPSYGVVSACAAGAQAIGAAVRTIQDGEAEAVVTGGSEAAITPLATAAFKAMGATSPSGHCRPFDARRDGFVMGEGAGVLVLEDAEAAEARGAEILGTIRGYGASADAFHLTAPEPDGRGAATAIRRALDDAELEPGDIDYVNAHGTSTTLNDRAETDALKAVLGPSAQGVPVSSTKSAIGHLLGAAGAVEAIALLASLRERVAPPTLGYGEPDEGLDLDYVPDSARPLAARRNGDGNDRKAVGISNSFGFGGHNVVLCLEATS